MHRLSRLGRHGFAVALSLCLLTVAGCGDGDAGDSAGAGKTERLASATPGEQPQANEARSGPSASPDGSRATAHQKLGRDGDGSDPGAAAGPGVKDPTAPPPSASKQKAASGHHDSAHAKGQGPSKSKGHGPKKPGNLPPPSGGDAAGLPPGMSVYDAARQACGDPQALETLPPERRNDVEFILGLAESFAPPGHEQEARDGCRAGLQDQGIG